MINTLDSLIRGSYPAFTEVFDLWWEKVYGYFLKKTKDANQAKDLTQELFIKLWKYRAQLSQEITLDEQIFKKARQVWIDWLRWESRRRQYFETSDFSVVNDQAQKESPVFESDIYRAIGKLPSKRKEIFELKHIHGYSYREIADYLGISIKTVDNQLLKANTQLRKILQATILLAISSQ